MSGIISIPQVFQAIQRLIGAIFGTNGQPGIQDQVNKISKQLDKWESNTGILQEILNKCGNQGNTEAQNQQIKDQLNQIHEQQKKCCEETKNKIDNLPNQIKIPPSNPTNGEKHTPNYGQGGIPYYPYGINPDAQGNTNYRPRKFY